MNKTIALFCFFLLFGSTLTAQENETPSLPSGLGISNQLKYSYDTRLKREILEDWFNLDYTSGIFTAGLRLETFQPNDPNTGISRGRERFSDIAFKYLKAEFDMAGAEYILTAGNYYALFGRGMLLKIYEDRNVRVDNNLSGIMMNVRAGNLSVTALSGMPANTDNDRTEVLHAAYAGYKLTDGLEISAAIASNQPQGTAARTYLYSGSVKHSLSAFDYYAEYGRKENSDITEAAKISGSAGKGFYGNLNVYTGSLSFSGEYKLYDNFAFQSSDGTVQYNTPPSLRKDYSFLLLNRHPSPLDASNEQGFGAEINYVLNNNHSLQLFGAETKTLSPSSLFKTITRSSLESALQLREIYLQYAGKFSQSFSGTAVLHSNDERGTNTQNITGAVEAKYLFSDSQTFRTIVEHQQTTVSPSGKKYYTDALTLEYLQSGGITLSWVSELETKSPESGKTVRTGHSFIQAGYKIMEHTTASVLVGSRQAGYICIGGVCRYEPAFSGIEFKMMTRL